MAEEPCDKAEREEDKDSAEGKCEDEPEYGGEGEFCGAAREVPDEPEAEDAVARADAGDKAEDEDAEERGVEGGHVVFSLVVKTNRALFLSLDHRFKEAFYLTAEVLDFCEGEAADLPVLSPADERELVTAGDPYLLPYVFGEDHLAPLVNGQDGFKPACGIRPAFAYGGFDIAVYGNFLFFTHTSSAKDLCVQGSYNFSDKSECSDFREQKDDFDATLGVAPVSPIGGRTRPAGDCQRMGRDRGHCCRD